MGSHGTTYALIALAIALVCIVIGFLWGKSNVQSKIENAVEKERVSLDAREFAMRQQLEDAIAELAKLRPLAEELGGVRERLKREQSKYEKMRTEFNLGANGNASSAQQELQEQTPVPEAPPESADIAIQKLLQSLEENLNVPDASPIPAEKAQTTEPDVPQRAETQTVAAQIANKPIPHQPSENRPTVVQTKEKPIPAAQAPTPRQTPPQPTEKAAPPPPAAKTPPQKPANSNPPAADEWQEFARSLANLTGRKQ